MSTIKCLPRWFVVPCLLAFGGSVWLGMGLPRGQGQPIALIFVAYNTQGKEIGARLTGPEPEVTPQPTDETACRLTRPIGTRLELRFQPDDTQQYGPEKTEWVIWRAPEEFRHWLDNDLPSQLRELDPHYNKAEWDQLINRLKNHRISDVAYDYPLVFRAQP